MEGHRVKLTEVNPYLVCVLCHGYLVDATTIAECLHSFCRSCIFRQLERKSICPICETHVHNTKLYRSLRPDKTLQDIVYKLVPGLFHNEMQRRRDFYKNHPYRDEHLEPECRGVGLDRLIYSPDDQISLSLEFYDDEREKEEWSNNSSPKPPQFAPSGPKRYLQCPAGFKMLHLKKFLRQKYGLSPSCNVDIMYRRECLPDSYSLMDVAYIYTWKRNSPMRFYYRMPDVIMKQLTAPPPEKPVAKSTNDDKQLTESVPKSPNKSNENKPEENKEVKKESNENIAKPAELVKIETPEKEKIDNENKEEEKQKTDEVVQPQGNTISSSRALSKQDELSVSVLLSLGQCRVDNKDEHKFAMPHPVTPKNGIIEKRNGKVSPKPSVNKIASDLAEHKAQQPQLQNSSPLVPPQNPLPTPNQQLNVSSQQKQQQIQQKQKQIQQMQQQKQKQQLKNQHLQQQKQQQFLHQKQQMHQLMQQQQQKLQQQIQQQHLLQQQQLQQIHLQQVQRHQLQQLHTQQPQILQLQVQPQLQLQQVIHQMKETKPLDQQPPQLQLQQQPVGEQPGTVANQAKPVANQILKIHQSPPVLLQSQVQQQPSQHLVQPQPAQLLVQQQQPQQPVRQQSPQHSVTQKPAQQLVQQPSTQPSVQQQLPQQPGQQQVPQQQTQQQQPQQLVTQQQSQQSVQQQQPQQLVQQQPSQPAVQSQSQQPLSQKTQNQQSQPQKSPQHQKSWPEPTTTENPSMNGKNSVQNPQVTLNTSNGSVTIMAQLKSPPMVPSPLGAAANSPGSPIPTMNGKSPETPRPQGIHQNLPRTVLPKSPFVNGKPLQKSIQQKNISGQRLNNNLPEGKNGLIQQSNINNRLPTFQKNGGTARKAGIPGGVISKTGPTLDQRIQQLYNSGQTNKPPSPGGKSESRLASWLNNRFKPQPVKEEPESTTPASPPTTKEVSMQRYKRKLQEMQKVQEICEITQENPKPDDAKRRREVTPDVSIELMRAADMKKIDTTKKEKRPMPGLKSIQEVGAKRKKEEDSALDLSKPGDMLRPQLPWLVSRPPHFIPSPRPT